MELVCDLHLHSKYSRAVSKKMTLPNMYLWAAKKGIHLLSVADFTHPEWYRHIQGELEEENDGIYTLKRRGEVERANKEFFRGALVEKPRFMLTTELSLIYSQEDVLHRVHLLVFAPNLKVVGKINKTFLQHDFTLGSDGRPTFGISCIELCEMLFSISPDIHIIPCHVWTPWFSLYGSRSGFDSIRECFGKYAEKIFAVETGLSSDPVANWRIEELENRSIVSFGDAHSFYKLGREATVLQLKDVAGPVTSSPPSDVLTNVAGTRRGLSTPVTQATGDLPSVRSTRATRNTEGFISYSNIIEGLKQDGEGPFEIGYTIEFYSEEGKYHFTGHRECGVVQSPRETLEKGKECPVCGQGLTVGVMHRVEDLAKRRLRVKEETDENGVVWQKDRKGLRPSYVSLVPLQEIVSEVVGKGVNTKTTLSLYDLLVSRLGGELEVLMRASLNRIESVGGRRMAEAIARVRGRKIAIDPGYDGVFGKVSVWEEREEKENNQIKFEF